MSRDPIYAYSADELGDAPSSQRSGIITALVLMLAIAVLSALVLMEPPMARSVLVASQPDGEAVAAVAVEIPAPVTPTIPMGSEPILTLAEGAEGAETDTATLADAIETAPAEPDTPTPQPASDSGLPEPSRLVSAVETAPTPTISKPIPRRARPSPMTAPKLTQDATGAYLIQIGSMSSEAAAADALARMTRRWPSYFEGVETEVEYTRLDDGREVHRLRIGGIVSKPDARAWCRAYQSAGGTCYVVG